MTDEEMAEKYADKIAEEYRDVKSDNGGYVNIKEAFLAGLKAGRSNWHDLHKDPEDLPKRDERFDTEVSVPVFSSKGNFVVYYFETKKWYCNRQKEEVVAWCEIPKFEG